MKKLNDTSLPQNINPIKMVSKENDLKKVPGKKCKRMIKTCLNNSKKTWIYSKRNKGMSELKNTVQYVEIELLKGIQNEMALHMKSSKEPYTNLSGIPNQQTGSCRNQTLDGR